jgi:hypothetical protein
LAHGSEESLKGFDGSFLAYPEQAGDAEVDLINQRQVFVALGVLDFNDADGVENLIPGGAKRLGRFLPRKAARPTRTAIHAAHGVEEENQEAPKGNDLKTPFGEFIVTRCGLMTARTDRGRAPPQDSSLRFVARDRHRIRSK